MKGWAAGRATARRPLLRLSPRQQSAARAPHLPLPVAPRVREAYHPVCPQGRFDTHNAVGGSGFGSSVMTACVWSPRSVLRFGRSLGTACATARVVTDAGRAYLKPPLPQAVQSELACEWIAAQLATWFELPTCEWAVLPVDAELDRIPLPNGQPAPSGLAFVTRELPGHPWGGAVESLEAAENSEIVTSLVVFDTWLRNVGRFPPAGTSGRPGYDRLLLAKGGIPGVARLVLLDQSQAFRPAGQPLDTTACDLFQSRDTQVYGLFPAFRRLVRQDDLAKSLERLTQFQPRTARDLLQALPQEWGVAPETCQVLGQFLVERAAWLAETLPTRLARICWPGKLFDPDPYMKRRS